MAYLQWYTGYTFEKINEWGVTVVYLLSLYPTHHEADISKLIETASRKMDETRAHSKAEAGSLIRLAKVLSCSVEDLLGRP